MSKKWYRGVQEQIDRMKRSVARRDNGRKVCAMFEVKANEKMKSDMEKKDEENFVKVRDVTQATTTTLISGAVLLYNVLRQVSAFF